MAIGRCYKTRVFCRKGKYKPGTRTREKLRSVEAFRRDETVRKSAWLHLKGNTNMGSIAAEISGICAKDLISSEARYHSTCYNAFVRIVYESDAAADSSAGPVPRTG